jgi:hypothetical protein
LAAKCGDVETMLWVDNASYFGPDRRRTKSGLRVLERRRENYASPTPSLSIAMRQLRMHVLDAQGANATRVMQRLRGVALIARAHGEIATSNALNVLADGLGRARGDMRQQLYTGLDRAHALLRAA